MYLEKNPWRETQHASKHTNRPPGFRARCAKRRQCRASSSSKWWRIPSPMTTSASLNRGSSQRDLVSPITNVPLPMCVRSAEAIHAGLTSRPRYSTGGSHGSICAGPQPTSITLSPACARTWFRMNFRRSAFPPMASCLTNAVVQSHVALELDTAMMPSGSFLTNCEP